MLDETDQTITETLVAGKDRFTSELAEVIEPSPRVTRTRLAGHAQRGLVRENGTWTQDPRRRYFLADRAPA